MTAPAPGTRVSSLTLRVRIAFQAQPYQVPEVYGPQLLKAALEHAGDSTEVEVLEATDHQAWVPLQPVYVRANGEETVSNSDIEARYRRQCAAAGRAVSQDGFLVHAIQEITGLQVGSF
jgi:hypothetical protein